MLSRDTAGHQVPSLPALLALALLLPGPALAATGAGDGPPGWWERARLRIERSRYDVVRAEAAHLEGRPELWKAFNPSHGFLAWFRHSGVRLEIASSGSRTAALSLDFAGWGRGDAVRPAGRAILEARGNRIELDRGPLTEWFVNTDAGLEHGFTLHEPPQEPTGPASPGGVAGEGRVSVVLRISGGLRPALLPGGAAISFSDPSGGAAVRYQDLAVLDAAGRELPSRMTLASPGGLRSIRLEIDDAGAVYPVTVDPLIMSPIWALRSNLLEAELGYSVGTAGDVNGDGYADIVVGAPGFDLPGEEGGRVFVFPGEPGGVSTVPAWKRHIAQAGARFGASVGTAGDVNGDGFSDVIAGAPLYDNGETDEGAAFVYLGSASGLAGGTVAGPEAVDWMVESDQALAQLGAAVSTAGDMDGDLLSDLIVGAPMFDNGQVDEGAAFLFRPAAGVLPGGSAATPADAGWRLESDQPACRLGVSVAFAGDVNADGLSDVIVGAPGFTHSVFKEGSAFLFLGSTGGPAGAPGALPADADWAARSGQAGASLGASVSTAGDVNGDGYSDLLIGSPLADDGEADEGQALLFAGSASGPPGGPVALPADALWSVQSDVADARMGSAVAAAGDVNLDGLADIAVGATYVAGTEARFTLFLGSPGGPAGTPSATPGDADWSAIGGPRLGLFGLALGTSAGFMAGGRPGLIVGIPGYDGSFENEGRVRVFSRSGPALDPGSSTLIDPGQYHIGAASFVASAGDVNGDGFTDVVLDSGSYIGTRTLQVNHGSPSGISPAAAWTVSGSDGPARSAGDVNGDGYEDLAVRFTEYPYGLHVYHGSPTGLDASGTRPAGDGTNADWILPGLSSTSGVGTGIPGDVNGDGFSDLLIGYPSSGSFGQIRVHYGSPAGLSPTPDAILEPDLPAGSPKGFGGEMEPAGDVDNDGFSDIIVGEEPLERACVYFGSPSGLSADAVWIQHRPGEQRFAREVGPAGDVNGDGFSDVAVARGQYPPAIEIFHGSAAGPSPAPDQTLFPPIVPILYAFEPMAPAGDLDGDGFGDFMVGFDDPNSTYRPLVYLGSPAGLDSMYSLSLVPEPGHDTYGGRFSLAGDVNGDGFADMILSETGYTTPLFNTGVAHVLYGHAGSASGYATGIHARRDDDSAPVALLGASESATSFRLAATTVASPLGRTRAVLEWEVKPLETPFDGTGLQQGSSWLDTGSAGTPVSERVTGLAPATPYHWQARLRFHPASSPLLPATPWHSPPSLSREGWHLRTAGAAALAAGAIPDGSADPGQGLIPALLPGGDIQLDWQPSCLASDTDYAIYEGFLATPSSHVPVACTTGGATSAVLSPSAGSTYYLVVPHNASREGSYGSLAGAGERPPSEAACLPQEIGVCVP